MTTILGYPFEHVMISAELSATEFAAVGASGVSLTGANLTGTTLTIAGEGVEMFELKEDAKDFRLNRTWGRIIRTSLNDEVERVHQGRLQLEATLEMYANTASNRSYDIVLKEGKGHRLVLVERTTGKRLVGVLDIVEITDNTIDEAGDLTYTVVLRNSGHVAPKWE